MTLPHAPFRTVAGFLPGKLGNINRFTYRGRRFTVSTVFPLEISIAEFVGIIRFFTSGKFNEDGVFDFIITDGNNVLSRPSRHGFESEDDDFADVEDITLFPRIRGWLTGTMYCCVEL